MQTIVGILGERGDLVSGGKVLIHKGHIQVINTEVSSFQGVGIEGFHCIQRCPHFRDLE